MGRNSTGGEANAPFTVAIAKDGQKQTFYRQGSMMWGFSDTLWWGEDHFTPCRHLEGKRGIVYFRPGSDKAFAGGSDQARNAR